MTADDEDTPVVYCEGCRGLWVDDDGRQPWIVRQLPDTCDACKQKAWDDTRERCLSGDPPYGVPKRQRAAKPSDLRPDLRRIQFASGNGAFLYGKPGRGKSFQAAALMARGWDVLTVRQGWPPSCRWWRTDLMIEHMKSLQGKDAYTKFYGGILECDVLVLDDMGAERATEWSLKQLLLVLSERYDQERCTIITSNFSLGELAERINAEAGDMSGERIASRIAEVCVRVHIDGEDRRLKPQLNGGHDQT